MNVDIPIYISSCVLPNNNVLSGLPLPMRPPFTLRTHTPIKLSHFFLATSPILAPMADQAKQIGQSKGDTSSPEKKEKIVEPLPPAPEKPLPDDCCGSGCVRCVWDVYYDELEAYNKLLEDHRNKAVPDSESN